jgi:hypothetical protein
MSLEQTLVSLKEEIQYYKKSIHDLAIKVLAKKISNYPIFIAHQTEIGFGEVILDREMYHTAWSISLSALEEFIQKKLVQKDKVDAFKEIYKDPEKYICIFLINSDQGNFVFIPYTDPINN